VPQIATDDSFNLLTLSNLAFERDDRLLFSGVNLDVLSGDIVQVAGPNGSGKTTLLRLLTGSLTQLEGDILWRGLSVSKQRAQFNSEILYLGHQPGIKAALSPEENLRWLGRLHATHNQLSIAQALHKVGLLGYEDVPCYSLSAGQHRRVSLARLYLSAAKLWILDEPFTAIDKAGVAQLELLIEQHAQQGGAVLLTTHQELSLSGVKTLMIDGISRSGEVS
jgi:heme exporter protein A